MSKEMKTPYYLFSAEEFKKRISFIKNGLKGVNLTFSVKANPFLLTVLPDRELISHVEVCSPGELMICKSLGVDGSMIIYSGVMKENKDIREAMDYGAGILTAESRKHYELICDEAEKAGVRPRVILRLTGGNQFGMSEEDILDILSVRKEHNTDITGIHFYSGTAKTKVSRIEKDLKRLRDLLEEAKSREGFVPDLVEYGPGLSAEYYTPPFDEADEGLFNEILPLLTSFGKEYPLGIEMGRFMAAPSGKYFTSVMDIKENDGVKYVIVDGGVHQLKYYGQNMAMKIPPLRVIRDGNVLNTKDSAAEGYTVCGSLCTVADVLVRDVSLPALRIGDVLEFDRCGAYSVSEGALSFLSRDLPEIWMEDKETKCLRKRLNSWTLNLASEDKE